MYDQIFSWETLYFIAFVTMLVLFIFGNKFCTMPRNTDGSLIIEEERKIRIDSGQEQLSMLEHYCENQKDISLAAGSIFIVFVVTRQFINKAAKKHKLQ